MTNLDSILKSRKITLPPKVHLVKATVFPVWKWELESKESWVLKNRCFWTVVLEKTLESPLDCKEIQPIHPKGDQSWVFTGRTDVETETPILWPPDAKSWLIWKDPDIRKDQRQEKGTTKDDSMDMSLSNLQGVGDGQGSLACCSPRGPKESDTTEQLNWLQFHLFDILKATKL